MSTSKNISKPSDDPLALSQILDYKRDLAKIQQAIRNAENASDMLSHTDTTLQQVADLLAYVRTNATTMATDTVDENARSSMANEIDMIIEQLIQKANTNFGGRYIFGGYKILEKPYQRTDDQIEYNGDQGEIEQRLGNNDLITVNIPGSAIFGSSSNGLFKILQDLQQALESNNTTGIQDFLSLADTEMNNITKSLGKTGARMRQAESNLNKNNEIKTLLIQHLSRLEDVDLAEESIEYMSSQQTYQATLEITSQTLQLPSLIDYLS